MNNIYGIKKINKKIYLEDIEYTEAKQIEEILFTKDRELAKEYKWLSTANSQRRQLKSCGIKTEVIVLKSVI